METEGRCYAAGFEEKGRTRNAKNAALETRKGKEMACPLNSGGTS